MTNILGKEMTSGIASEKGTLQRRVTHLSGVTLRRKEEMLMNIAMQGLVILSKVMLLEESFI